MSDTIIAALISAGSAVIVAVIGKLVGVSRSTSPGSVPSIYLGRPLRRARSWIPGLALLGLWLIISPWAIHHDLAGINFLVIPVPLLIVALLWPVPPLTAAGLTLAVFAANLLIVALSAQSDGRGWNFRGDDLALLVAVPLVSAALVAAATWWRLREAVFLPLTQASGTPGRPGHESASGVVQGIERLATLHRQGQLTDTEFKAAKDALLGGPSS